MGWTLPTQDECGIIDYVGKICILTIIGKDLFIEEVVTCKTILEIFFGELEVGCPDLGKVLVIKT